MDKFSIRTSRSRRQGIGVALAAFSLALGCQDDRSSYPDLRGAIGISVPDGGLMEEPTEIIITYDFEVDNQGFRGDYGTSAVAEQDSNRSALVITPSWNTEDNQNIIGEIAQTDYTGARIDYTVTVTQAQVDGGMVARAFVQTGESGGYTRIYGEDQALTAGSNSFTYTPEDNGEGHIEIVERVGLEFGGPITSGTEDEILLNEVIVALPPPS